MIARNFDSDLGSATTALEDATKDALAEEVRLLVVGDLARLDLRRTITLRSILSVSPTGNASERQKKGKEVERRWEVTFGRCEIAAVAGPGVGAGEGIRFGILI